MRHIVCGNYVAQQLANAKNRTPRYLNWLLLIAWGTMITGIIGFFVTLSTNILFYGKFVSFPFPVIPIPTGFSFFILALLGLFLFYVGCLVAAVRPNQVTLQQLIRGQGLGDDIGRLEAGLQGEESVARELQKLDDRWVLLSGVALEGMLGDVDHVLIGPAGIFALEVKNWSGRIEYNDETVTWIRYRNRQPQGEVLKDPAEQIVQVSGVLSRFLKTTVTPVIVFVHPNSIVVAKDHPRATVLVLSQLLAWAISQPSHLSPDQVNDFTERLSNAAKKPSDASSIADKAQAPNLQTTVELGKRTSRLSHRIWIGCHAVLIVSVLAIAVGALLLTGPSSFFGPHSQGCSVAVTSYIRSGPSLQDKLLGTVPKGTCFSFDGRTKDGSWIRISGIGKFQGDWTLATYFSLKPEQLKNLPVLK